MLYAQSVQRNQKERKGRMDKDELRKALGIPEGEDFDFFVMSGEDFDKFISEGGELPEDALVVEAAMECDCEKCQIERSPAFDSITKCMAERPDLGNSIKTMYPRGICLVG
jgi:hypothetical protein